MSTLVKRFGFSMAVLAATALLCGGLTPNIALAAKYTIKVTYENNPGEPFDLAMHEWARLFKEATKGEGELRLFPSSQLGQKKDVLEQMRMGAGIITLTDGAYLADFLPDFAIMMGPYLGKDYKDIFKISEGPWFKEMGEKLQDKGFHILAANWLFGVRHTLLRKPAQTPGDFKGLKIRTPITPIQIETVKAMGGTPTPMPLSEVYTSLTTGVIDGAENPIPVLYGQKHHEVAKYLILTGHCNNVTDITIGWKYFQTLPEGIQKPLAETCHAAGDFLTALILKADREIIEKMKKEGVTVIEVDQNLFRDATQTVYEQFPAWTPGLYQSLQDYLAKN